MGLYKPDGSLLELRDYSTECVVEGCVGGRTIDRIDGVSDTSV